MSELPKTYDPKSVEDKLYSFWNDSGFSMLRSIRTKSPIPSSSRPRTSPASCTWATRLTKPCRTS